jgi:hypothetical protein
VRLAFGSLLTIHYPLVTIRYPLPP